MQLTSLVPMLSVANVERTLRFYHDALQFDVVQRFEQGSHLQWACVKSGQTTLMFARCEVAQSVLPFGTQENLVLYFYPDDVTALHASLKAREYPVSDLRLTCYHMREFELCDPDGYQLWFGQEAVACPTA